MNPAQLLAHFDRLAEAPDAVPRLRRFILDLAVRGKLVEQEAPDEPASDLFRRIRGEKLRFAEEGSAGRRQRLPKTANEAAPFHLPETWLWVSTAQLFRVLSDRGKKVATKDVLESGWFPVVNQGKVLVRGYCDDEAKVIRLQKAVVVFGDHTREIKFVDFDFVVGADGVKILDPILLDPKFFCMGLTWLPMDSRGYGRHYRLLRESCFPLPPLAEQHRIVAKVDELMGLCDRLEAARAERERLSRRFLEAVIHEALLEKNGEAEVGDGATTGTGSSTASSPRSMS